MGSTGSIGTQTLDVVRGNSNLFGVFMLTAQSSADLLIEQALEFAPAYAVICDNAKYNYVKDALAGTDVKVLSGINAIIETVTHPDITRFFMTIPEACLLVIEAGVMGQGGEMFHLRPPMKYFWFQSN